LGKWAAQIQNSNTGKKQWLGTFDITEEEAHAYDVMALEYQRPRAQLNFPLDVCCASV
jgi:hypothetical protein